MIGPYFILVLLGSHHEVGNLHLLAK